MKKGRFITIFFFAIILLASSVSSFAADEFFVVRSENFHFVGEIGEEKLRREAVRLEQFRESFKRAFPLMVGESTAPLTVLIFKDAQSFAPFKPVLENGLTDNDVSGFFQSNGEDNCIAFSLSGNIGDDSSETLFHEYVHFLLKKYFQTADLPAWLGEGLAEYFQTFRLTGERRAVLGEGQKKHLQILRRYKIFPLKTLFEIDYAALSKTEIESKRLFYAQSWIVVYHLMRSKNAEPMRQIENYLGLIAAGKTREIAFEETFEAKYREVETEIEKYASKKYFEAEYLDLSEKNVYRNHFSVAPISRAEWFFYLGDLLFQSRRLSEASQILAKSLALDEKSAQTNLLLGKIFLERKNYAESIAHLEKSLALDAERTDAGFFLARALYQENLSEEGFVNPFSAEKAEKMRRLLKKAIGRNFQSIEAYQMLASISMVNSDDLGETIEYLRNGAKIEPRNFHLKYNLARLFLLKKDYESAQKITGELSKNCAEKEFCERVKTFGAALDAIIQREKEIFELKKKYGLENVDFDAENLLPPAEAMNRALNRALRKPLAGEKRFVGNIKEIVCDETIEFKIAGESQSLSLSKKSFDGITLISFSSKTAGMRIECGRSKTEMFVVATYKTNSNAKKDSDGEIFALEFVPKEFKLIE